jgi:hypothetical protein
VEVHSLTLSALPGSLLVHTFVSPCFGRKLKAKVATTPIMPKEGNIENKQVK